jgi:PBP1b-binding outer membrane lipoprotein LpoB
MKKFVETVKKYKVYILTGFLLIFFFRSCTKSTEIKKLDKKLSNNEVFVDSLQKEIKVRQQKIDSLPELIRIEKINIHLEYDEWVSSKDRGQQLMELHSLIKNNIRELQKK